MNTLKKIVTLVLMTALLVCVSVAFASCSFGNQDKGDGTVTHCPDDCECRADETPDESEHCPADCECRVAGDAEITYLVVIRDDQGNIVPGVSVKITDGASFVEDRTDDNGFLTFSLIQGTWHVQVTAAPDGYRFDPSVKHEFNAEGVCAITLEKPVGYVFNVKSFYDDAAVKNAFVTLYSFNEETDAYDIKVAEGISDADGKVIVEALAGAYKAVIFVDGYAPLEIDVPAPAKTDVFDASLVYVDGTDELAPILPGDDFAGTFDIEIAAGKTVWYAFRNLVDSTLVIDSETAVVYVNGEEHYADEEDDIVSVKIPAADTFTPVIIGFSTTLEEGTDAYEAVITYEEGTKENPVAIESLDELAQVVIPASTEWGGAPVYYSWIADFDGYLTLSSSNEKSCLTINNYGAFDNKSIVVDGAIGAPFVRVAVEEGDNLVFVINAISEDAEGNLTYPGATLAFEASKAVSYKTLVADYSGNAFAGQTVTIYKYVFNEDTYTNDQVVYGVTVTDASGNAEIYLPYAEDYIVSATAPDGYTAYEAEFGSTNVATVLLANGSEEAPFSLADAPVNVRGIPYIEIPKETDYYYFFKIPGKTNLTFNSIDFVGGDYGSDGVADIYVTYNGVIYGDDEAEIGFSPMMGATITLTLVPQYANTVETVIVKLSNVSDVDCVMSEGYAVGFSTVKEGSQDMPKELLALGAISAEITVEEMWGMLSAVPYYFKWTANKTGLVSITGLTENGSYRLTNESAGLYGDTIEGLATGFIPVIAGDVIVIEFCTLDFNADNVNATIAFEETTEIAVDYDADSEERISFQICGGDDGEDEDELADEMISAKVTLTNYSGKTIVITGYGVSVDYNGTTYVTEEDPDTWVYMVAINLVDGADTLVVLPGVGSASNVNIYVQ